MPSARRGWGTQRAIPGAPAAQRLCPSTLGATCTQWATTGAPDAFRGATSARRGSGTRGANPGAPMAQRRCSSAPKGSSTQWATAGAPEAPCGKEWWARQEKEPLTKPGWAEPRTMARSQCSANHLGQRAEQGTWGSGTRKRSGAGCGRPEDGGVWTAKTVNPAPQQPAQPQYTNCWAPLTRKRHIPPHSAQPRHTNYWAPRTRKRHQQEHRPRRPTERSDPTQHAKGRAGDCPGPRKGTTTRRPVTPGAFKHRVVWPPTAHPLTGLCGPPLHTPSQGCVAPHCTPPHRVVWPPTAHPLTGLGGDHVPVDGRHGPRLGPGH